MNQKEQSPIKKGFQSLKYHILMMKNPLNSLPMDLKWSLRTYLRTYYEDSNLAPFFGIKMFLYLCFYVHIL